MPDAEPKKLAQRATEKLFDALNRADELGGEVRDYMQEQIAANPRYVAARKKLAGLFGRGYESRAEADAKAKTVAAKKAAVAAPTVVKADVAAAKAAAGFGNPAIKAQLFGTRACPWTGRAITLLERHKVDFDFVDLDESEHEAKRLKLTNETRQHTVPYVYLRGQFIGGFNALAEIERLGQLDVMLLTPDERAALPAHQRIEVVARPNTDDIVPAEEAPGE